MRMPVCAIPTLLIAGLLASAAASIQAKPTASKTAQDDPRVDRTWVREWPKFAPFYVPYEGGYVCFPTYDPDRPSSTTTTVEEYIRETAYQVQYPDAHGRERNYIIAKPAEDAQAALWLLDDPQAGQYGYIHSGEITRILDDNELVMDTVYLLDVPAMRAAKQEEGTHFGRRIRELIDGRARPEYRKAQGRERREDRRQRERAIQQVREMLVQERDFRFADRFAAVERHKENEFARRQWRIIGFNTTDLVVEERWPQGDAAGNGLHLAIVEVDDDFITAIPAALLGRELTELQFLEVIESRGLTKAQFVELVNQARREHRRDYIPAVVAAMEGLDEEAEDQEQEDIDGGEGTEDGTDDPVNDTVELAE